MRSAAPAALPPRRLRHGLLALALLAGLCASARAQRHITIPPERLAAPETGDRQHISLNEDANERGHLRDMVVEWKQFVQEGNTADASDLIGQMKELLGIEGIKDKETVLAGLVALGNDWAQTQDWPNAERAYKAALDLEPSYAPAHLGEAQLARHRDGGFRGTVGLLAGVVQASRARLATLPGFLGVLANIIFLALLALAATVAGIALVLLVKNLRLLRHGMREWLADRVPDGVGRAAGWIFALLPVILWLSPPWWVIYWLVLLSGYGSAGLKRLAALALVVVALLPAAFYLETTLASLPSDPVVKASADLDRGDVSAEDVTAISALAQPAYSRPATFMLARLQSAARRPDDAVSSYNTMTEHDGSDIQAIVNRGNIHFRRGDLAQAIADYKLANDKDAKSALALRNGSIAFAQNLQADISSDWTRRAQAIDRNAVIEWNREVGEDHPRDAELSRADVLHLVAAERSDLLPGLYRSFLNPFVIAAVIGLVLIGIRSKKGMGPLEAGACEKCGRAFCSRCHAAARNSAYCTQCVHLYVKKDGVSPVVRTAKLREVERHLAVTNIAVRLFNRLLPGAGSLYANRLVVGTLLLFLWSGSLAALLLSSRMVMDPTRLGHADLTVIFAIELVTLVTVYLVALMQSLRHSS